MRGMLRRIPDQRPCDGCQRRQRCERGKANNAKADQHNENDDDRAQDLAEMPLPPAETKVLARMFQDEVLSRLQVIRIDA